MDKLHEESRMQFEHEMSSRGWSIQKTSSGDYVHERVVLMWMAWQASRASIVVDTPPLCGDGENDTEYTEGYNDGITATEKAITSIGLSIKGE